MIIEDIKKEIIHLVDVDYVPVMEQSINVGYLFTLLDKYKEKTVPVEQYQEIEHKYKLAKGNYNTALKVISDTDDKLKEYLEKENKI